MLLTKGEGKFMKTKIFFIGLLIVSIAIFSGCSSSTPANSSKYAISVIVFPKSQSYGVAESEFDVTASIRDMETLSRINDGIVTVSTPSETASFQTNNTPFPIPYEISSGDSITISVSHPKSLFKPITKSMPVPSIPSKVTIISPPTLNTWITGNYGTPPNYSNSYVTFDCGNLSAINASYFQIGLITYNSLSISDDNNKIADSGEVAFLNQPMITNSTTNQYLLQDTYATG